MLVRLVAFANMRIIFGQISQTSQPEAVSKVVVVGRSNRFYVRSMHFGAGHHNSRGAYGFSGRILPPTRTSTNSRKKAGVFLLRACVTAARLPREPNTP